MSFPEKCSFAPPKVYGGSLQRASSSAGEMSVNKKVDQFMELIVTKHIKPPLCAALINYTNAQLFQMTVYNPNCISMHLERNIVSFLQNLA